LSARTLGGAILALALAGVGVTSYLVAVRYSGGQALCSTGGCEAVQHSRYAKVGGVPVAALGLAGYLALLGTSVLRSEIAAFVGACVAVTGFVFALYLVYVQVALIGATCDWCLASDALLALLVPLTLLRLHRTAFPPGERARRVSLSA
jgi:uncharacterized membrane protein